MGMFFFIASLVLALIGVCAIAGGFLAQSGMAALVGAVALVVAIGVLLVDSYTSIPTRSVGIQTFGGRPIGQPLGAGYHWVAPWHDLNTCDGTVQSLNFTDDDGDDGKPLKVRLANSTTADVNVRLQWNLANNQEIVDLFGKYRGCGNVRDLLVKGQLQHVLNVQFAKYEPMRSLTGGDKSGPSIDDLAAAARTDLQNLVGNGISIGTLTVPIIHYDKTTEDRLHAIQQSIGNTRIAEQDKLTAEIVKQTNDLLAASTSSKDPGVQFQNCLSMIDKLSSRGQLGQLPVNSLQCVAGQGGGVPVIVNAAK